MSHTLESTILTVVRKRLVNDYPVQIRECVDSLNDESVWWRPNEKANSIGNLILHLCGSTRFYLLYAIGGNEFERDRAAEFSERRHLPRAELLQKLNEVVAACDGLLAGMNPERLMETTERTGKTSSFAQILLQVFSHFAIHTGQIVYATKSLKEGAIDELWMKTRG